MGQDIGADEKQVVAPLADHPCTACVKPLEEQRIVHGDVGQSNVRHNSAKGLLDLTRGSYGGRNFTLWWSGVGRGAIWAEVDSST